MTMICVEVLAFCLLVTVSDTYGDYFTPSEEVGRKLSKYDPNVDKRYPFELGMGHYYQGDIMLEPSADGRVSIPDTYTSYIWPNGTVPYEIGGNFNETELNKITAAMNMFKRFTCVRFVPKTEDDDLFVTITNNNTGCFAYIGRRLNNQNNLINLQTPECLETLGTPLHEMMHVLGFFHEFVRPDRDDYIYINRSALLPELQSDEIYFNNFAKLGPEDGQTYNISYNYGSVMHYSRYAGAQDQNYPVLINKKTWFGDFGNLHRLTSKDVLAINYRYSCAKSFKLPMPITP